MNQLDQYHEGNQGFVFDAHVKWPQVDFGWDVETTRDVAAAVNLAMTELGHYFDPEVAARLHLAICDLDFRCALAESTNRHPSRASE